MPLTLLLGGARAGKSGLAVRLAEQRGGPVTVIATARAGDEEMAARIRRHRSNRPEWWVTVEEPVDLTAALAATPADAVAVVDCLTLWVSNLMELGSAEDDIVSRARTAATLARSRPGTTIAVSNEVGSGIVPASPLARGYRDTLGRVNALWADAADIAALVVAGRVLLLDGPETIGG